MRTTRKTLIILEILFLLMMSISGIYATTAQIDNAQLITGKVDIQVLTYKLNNEHKEVKYDEDNKTVFPGEVISIIPKIKNEGANCYIRAKIFYINDDVDVRNYITGMTDAWEKIGDYFYYKEAVSIDKVVKVFDTITIPNNIDEITNSKTIKLVITADAVQEDNFTPDYTKEDPWNGIVPVKSVNSEYDIDTNNNRNITIKYENGVDKDINVPNSFLEGMNNVMPGDSYSSSIEINNTDKKNGHFYVTIAVDDNNQSGNNEGNINGKGLLNELELLITNDQGQVVYKGNIKNGERILLGKYGIGNKDRLNFKVIVPNSLSNEYANIAPKINWTFSVDYDKEASDNGNKNNNEISPQTGDKINVSITIFIISAIGLVIVLFLSYRERKNIE